MKVREWIPHIGPLTKVILLKLFLDMVPGSSEDATRGMRGKLKRLSRNYRRRNGGKAILYVLISFHSRDIFCTLSRLFVRPCFRLFCARLAVHYLAVYSVLGSFWANFNGNGNEYNSCVSIPYNFCSFLCLSSFTKGHKRTTWNSHILHIWENVNYKTANF